MFKSDGQFPVSRCGDLAFLFDGIGFNKLAGNARRFKMLIGMSLQEFDLLLVKVEKMYPEEERKRLSKWLW